ncbi:ATP-binding protein [Pelagicoccus sp. SDUM812003]|uniref:hybrid sensor histidine kinase/response regulator n=1 Tax=Pelagicoccus sp. SDUM812003 TaxID=3041267 RepID=UPI00280DDD0B|nr:ATP-binding protein [Pelagicoccus sp. SDUM812003]MDQ8205122.1 ATP-binding protein [Pelagicoccus sp. SDUM812003]
MAADFSQTPHLIPTWIFEQDYLVFLSFFGWMLMGLLAWTKPLSQNEGRQLPWLWIGFYAFSQALSDFLRTLSFSDPFFRDFNLEIGFEMLGYGLLVEMAMRSARLKGGKQTVPYAAIGGLFLGLSIEIGDLLYTLVVSFLVSVVAVVWAARQFVLTARKEKRLELYVLVAGLILVLPTWFLVPDRLSFVGEAQPVSYEDFPYYGFDLLFLRIASGWLMLIGLWVYRLQWRIEDVAPKIAERLRFWGYRVLPGALSAIILASYLITSWNGQRTKDRMGQDYLSRSQTAALAMSSVDLSDFDWDSAESQRLEGSLAGQLMAIKRVGLDVRSVYLWRAIPGEGLKTVSFESEQNREPLIGSIHSLPSGVEKRSLGASFLEGPFLLRGESFIHVSSPLIDRTDTGFHHWLGIDLAGETWFQNVSLTRLQSIIIAGLILALVIFFLYYQIDHESEADLVLAKERAEAADRAKSEFLAVISHEIRTPLQSVLGYSDLLRGTRLDEKQLSCLDTIQSEGKILLRIVQDILDFSNLRKASFELQNGAVQLHRLIEETYRTIQPMARRRGLQAHLEIESDVPTSVLADGVRLRQVLLNLFGNSVKYTEEGDVWLRAFVDRERESRDGFSAVRFEILDTGVGIKKEDLGRLFEPFIQLEHSTRFPREGAGLGLAIVSRIIELMGGSIAVESEFGVGSTFTVSFEFKVLEDEYAAREAARERESSVGEDDTELGKRFPLKLLVVDDNHMVRRLMLQYLDSLGYEAEEFDGGREAAEKGHGYDVVIMDLRMPGVDGPQAASAIRERSGNQERPWIVAVSASLQEEEVRRARDAGVNDFLGKPFYAGQLAERFRAIPWFWEKEVDVSEIVDTSLTEEPPRSQEHVPLFIGPASQDDPDSSALAKPKEQEEEKAAGAAPSSVFAGIDSYPEEAVKAAIAEVYSKHQEMVDAAQADDWELVREVAHYLANTAMALGIDQLYLDSKAVESAALREEPDKVAKNLEELRLNFEAWESDE